MHKIKYMNFHMVDTQEEKNIPIGVDAKNVDFSNGTNLEHSFEHINYNQLENKPKINGHILQNDITIDQLGIKNGKDAMINGVNTLILRQGDNITLQQMGNELTISATHSDSGDVSAVKSVNGKTGIVTLVADDINFSDGESFQSKLNTGKLKGQNGKTPVKGVDYYTESEKQQFMQDVIAELPKWTGGVY